MKREVTGKQSYNAEKSKKPGGRKEKKNPARENMRIANLFLL